MLLSKKIKETYCKTVFTRNDDTGAVFYFSSEDFPGLIKEPFTFLGEQGQCLQGYFYSYPKANPNRLIVFDHGMGGGHRSYMREIQTLAKGGYSVFAYDHTGCMESEGEHSNGLTQSLSDLNACLNSLKQILAAEEKSICVIGHSWGGYATMNIAAFHPNITHLVALSGFISAEQMLKQKFRGWLRHCYTIAETMEKNANPNYFHCNAIDCLKNTTAKALIIHSDNDKTVEAKYHFNLLKQYLSEAKNIEFLCLHKKEHNPNYTKEAIRYKNRFFKTLQRKYKKGQLSTAEQRKQFTDSFNWWKITEQDPDVWAEIFRHLEK